MYTEIYDLNEFTPNERNGTYGGREGKKEGIKIGDNYWIVKYPKSTKGMRGDLASYTTSPLSEYIGSHIYDEIGIDVHTTILGIRNGKLVVACKDFCEKEGSLREIRTLKNIYNKDLSEMLENSFSSTSSSKLIDINEELLHLEYNPILKNVPNVKERFWDMFIVDILINNNDRNNGNWGVLYSDNQYILAPVFDNGAAFSTKLPDYKLEDYLNNPEKMEKSINGCATTYALNGKIIKAQDIANTDFLYTNSDFVDAVKRIVPIIQSKKREIIELIQNIPTECDGISVCSDIRKEFYCKTLSMRVDEFLTPALTKAKNIEQNSQSKILNHSKPQRRR